MKLTDTVLTRKAEYVRKVDFRIINLINEMKKTIIREEAIGLAANQVGILYRIIIVKLNGKYVPMINPKITSKSDEMVESEEECLSFPKEKVKKERHEQIEFEFINTDGEKETGTATGLQSIAIQHEIDHLDGITICKVKPKTTKKKGKRPVEKIRIKDRSKRIGLECLV